MLPDLLALLKDLQASPALQDLEDLLGHRVQLGHKVLQVQAVAVAVAVLLTLSRFRLWPESSTSLRTHRSAPTYA